MTTDLRDRTGPTAAANAARAARWLLPALAAVLAACAGSGGSRSVDADPMATLERRALERWQLLIERKPELAYDYLTPGFRSTRSLADYQAAPSNPAVQWTGISWHQAECPQPDSCQVRLLLDYRMSVPRAGNVESIQELTERWLRIDGTWYHLPAD